MKEWSLKLYDTSWYEDQSGNWSGVRSQYRFEWVPTTATLAEKKTYFAPVATTDMYNDLERLSIRDDIASVLHVAQEMSEITAADCELLIAEVADYYN